MESPRSPPGTSRRHVRNVSHPTPTRATRGPLEAVMDDPLGGSTQSPPPASNAEVIPPKQPDVQEQASSSLILDLERDPTAAPEIDASFLQQPSAYHQLVVDDILKAFLDSEHQPASDASLPDLLAGGHFRRAAEKAVQELLAAPPNATEVICQLLYTRLACLVLISRPDMAAQEALPLLDFMLRNSPGAEAIVPLIPWELRLLLVRLQSIGAVDGGRRGIMALYALSGEVRAHLRRAREQGDHSAVATWTGRLQDLGLRVGDALVEMGELETATRHLDSLTNIDADGLAYRKALLRVRVGDVAGARRCASTFQDSARKQSFDALLDVADGEYATAAQTWQRLGEDSASHELFAQNAAVCLLYTGRIATARAILEDLSARLPVFPTLLFNLSTVYELCTERAVQQKNALAERLAAREPGPDSGGWERAAYEIKL